MGKKRRRKKHSPATRPADTPTGGELSRLGFGWPATIFALALLLRLLVTAVLSRTVLYTSPQLDQFEFLEWARSIAAGSPIWIPSHAPGYPFFLGTLLGLFDGSVNAARYFQCLFGAALCVLVTLLGNRFFGRRSGIAAGLLLALYAPLIFVESGLLAEGLFIFLLLLSLLVFTTPGRPLIAVAVCGLVLGLATIVRATGVVLLPGYLLLLLFERRLQRRWLAIALLAGATLTIVLPVAHSFGKRFDSGLFLQGFGGLNFLMGNDPDGQGVPSARLGKGWDLLSGEAFRAGATTAGGRERYYYRRGLRQIAERPSAFVRLLLTKLVWLTQNEEIRESHSFYFFRQQSLLLRLLPGFWLLFPLSCCGLAMAARARKLPPALAVYLLCTAASCILFVVSLRYRLPLVPVLTLFAGAGAIWLYDLLRQGQRRQLAGWSVLLALALVATQLWSHSPSRNFGEELALTASSLERDGDFQQAETTYRQALETDPSSAYAWTGLGRVYLKQGDLERSEEALRRALEINADYSRAHGGLGAALWTAGRTDEAIESYRRALWLSPDTPFIARDLATLLAQRGDLEEAARVFRQILIFNKLDVRALLALARIEGARERPVEGMAAATRAAELEPDNLEAWVLYAALAIQAGDLEQAERTLQRATALTGPNDPRILFVRALVHQRRGETEQADRLLGALIAQYPDFDPGKALFFGSQDPGGDKPRPYVQSPDSSNGQ